MFCFKKLVCKACRLYNVFGSGAQHAPHAQFMAQSAIANKGRKVGLLRGATTRFATWFYAFVRLLRMKDVLVATIHQLKFRALQLNDRDRLAVLDIQDPIFWKALYTLLRAVYPGLRNLRMADGNKPAMDQSYYLTHRATIAINKSIDLLNDEILFSSANDDYLISEQNEVFGDNGNEEEEEEDEDEDEEEEEEEKEVQKNKH